MTLKLSRHSCVPVTSPQHMQLPSSPHLTSSQNPCWNALKNEEAFGELEWSQGVWFQEWHGEKQPPKPLPTMTATGRPTLPQLINFETQSGSIKITECIGTSYGKLGPLQLRDDDGSVTQAIRDQYHHDAAKINYERLQRWIQGKGRQPVQ